MQRVMTSNDSNLLCPKCKSEFLHHSEIAIFDRREDKESGIQIKCNNGNAFIETDVSELAGNPSSRRDGLTIRFWCEICDITSTLCIAQHKGNTECYWRD